MGVDEKKIAELREQLVHRPANRYPIEHATTLVQLAQAFLDTRRTSEAVRPLYAAIRLFETEADPIGAARSRNVLGAALRMMDQLDEAADAFVQAVQTFEEHDKPSDAAAARFNLGLVYRESGEPSAALDCFERTLEAFDDQDLLGQAAAAAYELGSTLLAADRVAEAPAVLDRAMDLARRAGHPILLGNSANTLGLAQLALGEPDSAAQSFLAAVAEHPRTLRPEGYAMARANLALAHEQTGDWPKARLAARQARDTPGAAEPVRAQAAAVLDRCPGGYDDLMHVLRDEQPEDRGAMLRDEMLRWTDAEEEERVAAGRAWVTGLAAWSGDATELAEAWLGVLLELPPAAMETNIRAALYALDEGQAAQPFQDAVRAAMVRFHPPQWMRLRHTFERIAAELGWDTTW